MRDSFVFYRSFAEAARMLEDTERLRLLDALIGYALDEAEDKVAMWLEKRETGEDSMRIVREVYPLYLEREAIKAFLKQNPSYSETLMNPQTVEEAVMLGAREAMVSDAEDKNLAELQLLFLEGEVHSLEEILGAQ